MELKVAQLKAGNALLKLHAKSTVQLGILLW